MLNEAIISFAASFLITLICGKKLIPVLKSIKMGQKILDIGPRWHKSKEGTPTMGGLTFIIAVTFTVLGFGIYTVARHGVSNIKILCINYIFILLCGLVGFVDDYVKFVKKQNKGLSAGQKLILQFLSAAAYLFALKINSALSTVIEFPFTDATVDLGIFYYILLMAGIVFTVNSVNLTDGIDGLAASVSAVAVLFFAVVCYKAGYEQPMVLCCAVFGGCAAFLVYNFHPAKVFMGDTGSLFLGGVVSVAALWIGKPVLLAFVGFIYFVESASVILQVLSYKLFGKRIFKMSPIHHHFEMCGWSEIKIVFVFSCITAIMSAIGVYGFSIR